MAGFCGDLSSRHATARPPLGDESAPESGEADGTRTSDLGVTSRRANHLNYTRARENGLGDWSRFLRPRLMAFLAGELHRAGEFQRPCGSPLSVKAAHWRGSG